MFKNPAVVIIRKEDGRERLSIKGRPRTKHKNTHQPWNKFKNRGDEKMMLATFRAAIIAAVSKRSTRPTNFLVINFTEKHSKKISLAKNISCPSVCCMLYPCWLDHTLYIPHTKNSFQLRDGSTERAAARPTRLTSRSGLRYRVRIPRGLNSKQGRTTSSRGDWGS